jgi:hypothetical protein
MAIPLADEPEFDVAKVHLRLSFQPTGFKLLLEILARGHINCISEVPFQVRTAPDNKEKTRLTDDGGALSLAAVAISAVTPRILSNGAD